MNGRVWFWVIFWLDFIVYLLLRLNSVGVVYGLRVDYFMMIV